MRLIRKQLPTGTLVAYFGDDITDRDAFRELRTGGIAVEVGRSDSPLAPYTLPDPDSVVEVLGRMLESFAPEVRKPGRSKKS